MQTTIRSLFLISILILSIGGAAADLTFEDRVTYRRLIEDVYWQHRSWPEGNTKAKPPLSEVLPEEILRKRVEDSLRLSQALEARWQRPITTEDLQAEIDRIVRETGAPEILQELFQAVGRDPQIIAEILVRPLLADWLAREAFSSDLKIHGAARRRAQAEYSGLDSVADMRTVNGAYREIQWLRWGDGVAKRELMAHKVDGERIFLDPAQWAEKIDWLDERVGNIPLGVVGGLHEDPERFSALANLERGKDRIRIAIVEWPKPDFDRWWSAARGQFASESMPEVGDYRLKPIKSVAVVPPNSWVSTGTSGSPPSARSNHTAVWTGSEMVIWGGDDGIGYTYSGSRYDPATAAWTAMTNTGHPSGRVDHTAVWAGDRVIVWGGNGVGGPINTGGLYNPTTNSWQATTVTGAPLARVFHTAVELGSRMIIWGGWDGDSYRGDGFKYNYFDDSWSPISDTDAPTSRSGHTAVDYTGGTVDICGNNPSAMVVFGGQNTGGYLGNGAFYCPTIDSWTALSSVGAPSARIGHTAVSTRLLSPGNEMIIWGGNDGTGAVQNGARWEFSLDAPNVWKPINLGGAPTARQGHAAVWINYDVMMIWGGYSGTTLRDTGSLYNPANNVWMTMTTTGAPTARKNHTAAMLSYNAYIWGGNDGAPTASGAGYVRPTDFILSCTSRLVTSVPGGTELGAFRGDVRAYGDFNNAVNLSPTAFPGSLMIWNNPLVVSSYESTDVDVFVDAGATLGDHTYYFRGDSGATVRFFEMTLRVQDFQLSCQPSSVTVAPGGSTNVTCTVSSENEFDDPVALSCNSGTITCSVSPTEVTPPRDGTVDAQLTITAGAGVTPRTYTITPTAQSHLAERFSSIEVIVQDGAGLIFADGFELGNTTGWSSASGN